jgi:hypothetical protein
MEFINIIPDEEAISKCAWCHNHIRDDMEVFGACAKLKPGNLRDGQLAGRTKLLNLILVCRTIGADLRAP